MASLYNYDSEYNSCNVYNFISFNINKYILFSKILPNLIILLVGSSGMITSSNPSFRGFGRGLCSGVSLNMQAV